MKQATAGLFCLVLVALIAVEAARAQEQISPENRSGGAAKSSLNQIPVKPVDIGKLRVESGVKSLLAPRSTENGQTGLELLASPANSIKMQPEKLTGLIEWRKDFKGAQQASRVSGKPILLFHMLGRLDDRFC